MTLCDYDDLGTYDYFVTLIRDLDLEDEFECVWGEPLEEFVLEISESLVIEEVLDETEDDFILVTNERSPAYRLLQIN